MAMHRYTPAEEKRLAKALEGVSDEYLACRDPGQRHPWEIVVDFHVYTQAHESGRRIPHVARDLQCGRCGTQKTEIFHITRRGLEKVRNEYTYPTDYAVQGVPRGVKPSRILWQERYRRSLEEALQAERGTRVTERSRR